MENPFTRGGIVAKESEFIGRQDQISLIRRRLVDSSKDSNMAIVASPGVGGSSLAYMALKSIKQELMTKKILLVDVKIAQPKDFFRQLARSIFFVIGVAKLKTDEIKVAYEESQSSDYEDGLNDAIIFFLEVVKQEGIKIIAIFDEFDNVRKVFKDRVDLFQALRDLGYYPTYRISWLVISNRPIKDIEVQSGAISTYDGIFSDKIHLRPYNDAEMLRYWELYDNAGIQLSGAQKDTILHYCGGYPKLLNQLGYEIFDHYDTHSKVNVEEAFAKVSNLFTDLYNQILEICSVEEKSILSEIASGNTVDVDVSVESLKLKGIINNKGVFSKHFADYVTSKDRAKTQYHLAIEELNVKNYYGIQNTTIDEIPTGTQWIFVTGENGYGKSLLLKAIFIGLNGETDGSENLTFENEDFEANIALKFTVKKDGQVESEAQKEVSKGSGLEEKFFAAYGASRLLMRSDTASQDADEKSSTSYSLFNNDGVLLNIENYLSRWFFQQSELYEPVRQLLIKILPHIESLSVNADTGKIEYREENSQRLLTHKNLASGPRSIIAMVGDMLIRLFQAQPGVKHPEKLAGIVIIDELDLHLHPKWQKKIVETLTETFPNVQFIVSTHSTIPFLGAPENSIFVKVSRCEEGNIIAEKLDLAVHPKEMLTNTLITSPLFDMDEFINPNSTNFRTEDTYEEIVENVRKAKAIEEVELPDDF